VTAFINMFQQLVKITNSFQRVLALILGWIWSNIYLCRNHSCCNFCRLLSSNVKSTFPTCYSPEEVAHISKDNVTFMP